MKLFLTLITVVTIITIIILIISVVPPIAAQTLPADVTNSYKIADREAVDGDILVLGKDGLVRATTPYDSNIFGVLALEPAVVLRSSQEERKPVIRTGTALVNVTLENGEIRANDYITSSETPGKGQKATRSGYVLGVALESLSSAQATSGAKVPVALRVEYAEISNARTLARLLDYLGASFLTNVKDPGKLSQIVRFLFAGLVLLVSFGFAFAAFYRSLTRAIEAIGRNPLARASIIFSLILNIGLILLIITVGLAAAVVILRV